MEQSDDKDQGKKKVYDVTTFPVPFSLGEIKKNIISSSNSTTKPSTELIINRAIQSHLKGNIQEAAKYYQDIINQGFNDHRVFSNYGVILKNMGKLQEAALSTRKAIELKPDFADAHLNLGAILKDLGKLREAEMSYLKAMALNPDLGEVHSNLGGIFRDLGKLQKLIVLSKSTLESDSINKGYKMDALLNITIANLLLGDFSEVSLNIKKTNELISQGAIHTIKEEKNRNHTSTFSRFITSLYPLLEKKYNNHNSEIIPHIGESHCLSFAHQTISISSEVEKIQPVLITGGKAWHFANNKNNQWKDSLREQIKNTNCSTKVFISFGEIDCRKDEGILTYAIKKNKCISETCEKTIKGYLDYMEEMLSQSYSKKYYFGVPAPLREEELLDELDMKRIEIVKIYNSILKKEVFYRGSYFLDVYGLTSTKDGENNKIHMCDGTHLSPKCLSTLFKNHLYKPNI